MKRRAKLHPAFRPLALACVLASPPLASAFAHALLQLASPSVGGTVRVAPGAVALTFSEEVEPRFSSIEVTDAAGHAVTSGAAHAEAGDARHLLVGLARLAPGTYRVVWHVTSVDTHKTEGSFTFTVAP
jgi:copper resistance protein C